MSQTDTHDAHNDEASERPSYVPQDTLHRGTTTPDIVVITGMSGAGRTEALHTFEDLGYYAIDNLPPSLILQLAELVGINSGIGKHLAVVCDVRSEGLFDELFDTLEQLSEHELSHSVVFLDSTDEALQSRYALVRRRHPIALDGESTIAAIKRERSILQGVRDQADIVFDTSSLTSKELRRRLQQAYSELSSQQLLEVRVFSFGYKYGMPDEADIMIDVRFLPNPYYDAEMRHLTGLDEQVSTYVLSNEETTAFIQSWESLLDTVMPGYVKEGKSQLSIAVGCTGGQHRSVTLAVQTAHYLRDKGYQVSLSHRDLARAQQR
ncbi:MAG: RNase adapter RapZ [Atopobiaceae bacterium]|nr:RNase adapter RapZ [Atopobiaceae bacterium]